MTTSTSTAKSTTTTAGKNSSGATITANDRVLHIGDSHSCGVYGKTIDGLMRETGAKVNTVAVAGSSPTWWMNGTTGKCGYYSKDENGNVTEPYWQTPMQTPKLQSLIDEYKPDAISVEELFFNNNQKTAINVAQARGIILVVGCQNNIPTYEYTPLQVKQAVVGYGRADKMQVQKMVKSILNVEKLPKLDDTTDSMAAAICHAHSSKFSVKL